MALGSTLTYAASGRYCGTLVLTGEPFFEGGISFVLPKGSNFTTEVSNATLQMKADGSLPSLEDTLRGQTECRLGTEPVLTFKKLRIFFFLAYAACLAVLLEMVMDPQSIKKRRAENNFEVGFFTRNANVEKVVQSSCDGACLRMTRDITD